MLLRFHRYETHNILQYSFIVTCEDCGTYHSALFDQFLGILGFYEAVVKGKICSGVSRTQALFKAWTVWNSMLSFKLTAIHSLVSQTVIASYRLKLGEVSSGFDARNSQLVLVDTYHFLAFHNLRS